MRFMKAGATSQTIYVEVLDSTSTTGARKTGLAYNTASLTAYYVLAGGSATAITLATLAAANSAWSSGGFKEVDATNMPGVYRLDVPNAAIASSPSSVITLKGATGMVQVSVEIQLTAVDFQDTVRFGMTALPNAAAEAAGGLFTRGTGAGQINQDANGRIDVSLKAILGTTLTETAGQIAAAFKQFFDVASPTGTMKAITNVVTSTNLTTNNDKTGYGLSSAAVQAIWDALTSALTTVGSIGKKLADWTIGTAQTGDAYARLGAPAGASVSADIAAIKSDTAAILVDTGTTLDAALAVVDGNVDTILADTNDIQTRLPAALVSGRIDASVGAMAANTLTASALATDAVTEISGAVWDEDATGHQTTGTFGQAIGDPVADTNTIYGAVVTGATGATIAADIITANTNIVTIDDFLDTEVAAILAAVDTEVGAIKAKTDQFVFTVANQVDANALSGGGGLDAAGVRSAVGLASANLDTQLSAIQSDTDNIQTRIPAALVSGRMDSSVGAMATDTLTAAALAADAVTEIQSGLATAAALATLDDFVDTEVAAILADTNELQTDWVNGGRLDLILDARASQTSVDDLPTNAELATALASADDAVLAAVAALNDLSSADVTAAVPTANANADALLDRANGIETSYTLRQSMRLMLSSLAGKLSGAATTTVTIRDVGDTKNRIVATVDVDGNRSAVTKDVS